MAGPAGEEGERKQLAQPEAEAADQQDLPDPPDDRPAMQRSEGHQERPDEEAPERAGAELLLRVLSFAAGAMRVVGETRLQPLRDRVARERRAGDGVELGLAEIEVGPLAGVPLGEIAEERPALRVGVLFLDAADVIRGVVGRAEHDLPEAESVRLDGDERLARAGVT